MSATDLLRTAAAALTAEKGTPMTETTPATPVEPLARTLLAVPEGHGAPHHDAGRIKPDDYVVEVDRDGFISGGRAHHQAEGGDWQTEDGRYITWAVRRADRPDALTVWPAVEVKIPTEHPAHLRDVGGTSGAVCAYMALGRDGYWIGVTTEGLLRRWGPGYLAFFTLPDGTSAHRDGVRPDGTPRFVKEGEK